MDADAPVVIHTTTNLGEAEILKNALVSEGIKCQLDSENQSSFVGILAVSLLVRAWDEERARQVLASYAHYHERHPGQQ